MSPDEPIDAPLGGRRSLKIPLKVAGYDIDVGGIVSNIVYIRWMEDLRQAFCDANYPVEEMIAHGFIPVLSVTEIRYKRAIRYGDRVVGRVEFRGFSGPRWTFATEVRVGDATCASSTQTGVFVRLADGRPMRVPADLVDRFARAGLDPGEPMVE